MSGSNKIEARLAEHNGAAQANSRHTLTHWALVALGAVLCLPLGPEHFVVFSWFSNLMRNEVGELSPGDRLLSLFLATAVTVGLTYGIHRWLSAMSPRGRLIVGIFTGIAALIAVSAGPILLDHQLGANLGNSLGDATEGGGFYSLLYSAAELMRSPYAAVGAIVAGFGTIYLQKGILGLLAVHAARADLRLGEEVSGLIVNTIDVADTSEEIHLAAKEQHQRTYAIALSEAALPLAHRAETYVHGANMGREDVMDQLDAIARGEASSLPEALQTLLKMQMPPAVNYAALPASGRDLPQEARDQLLAYAAHLRNHYSVDAIMKELKG